MTATVLNEGFVLREDAALKARLQGIHVPVSLEQRAEDTNDSSIDEDSDDGALTGVKLRKVAVYFRLPEDEIRQKAYPYITIDFLGPVRDVEREHRGVADYGRADDASAYTPDGVPTGGGRVEFPIPMQLHYQVTTYSRYNRHDRQINLKLMTDVLEPRFGYLEMVTSNEALDDHSIRRLDLLSGPNKADMRDARGKRVFRTMYTVSVSSELFHSDFVALTAAVSGVVLDVHPLA